MEKKRVEALKEVEVLNPNPFNASTPLNFSIFITHWQFQSFKTSASGAAGIFRHANPLS